MDPIFFSSEMLSQVTSTAGETTPQSEGKTIFGGILIILKYAMTLDLQKNNVRSNVRK